MKAVVKTGPFEGAEFVNDFPEPEVGPSDVLIEVHAASVCGSDREFYRWGSAAKGFNMTFPRVLGHEGSGIVISVGEGVHRFSVGDRVALDSHAPCGNCFQCRTGNGHNCDNMKLLASDIDGVFAERVAVPESMVFKIPNSMSFEVGALLEPAGVAWHAIQRAGKQIAGNCVLVSGCGPIGLLLIKYAQLSGASEVLAIEPNEFRRSLAGTMGAVVFEPNGSVLDYIAEHHGYRGGVDVAFEVSGSAKAYPDLFRAVRKNGQIVSVGHAGDPIAVNVSQYLNKKELTLHGIYGRLLWDTWEDLTELIATGRLSLDWLITDHVPLGELGPIIDMLNGHSNKVVIYPQGVPEEYSDAIAKGTLTDTSALQSLVH